MKRKRDGFVPLSDVAEAVDAEAAFMSISPRNYLTVGSARTPTSSSESP